MGRTAPLEDASADRGQGGAAAPLIVVIDDSFEDRFFLRRAIRKLRPEAEVKEFTYCQEALDFLLAPELPRGPLAVFVDINIPRMDGFEFLERYAKAGKSAQGALVVMMSNSIDPSDRARADSLAMVRAFQTKPVTREVIGAVIEALAAEAAAMPGAEAAGDAAGDAQTGDAAPPPAS